MGDRESEIGGIGDHQPGDRRIGSKETHAKRLSDRADQHVQATRHAPTVISRFSCRYSLSLEPRTLTSYGLKKWLPRMDSNHDKQIQNLLCYRYTTRQW